jgi:hypothetical protein
MSSAATSRAWSGAAGAADAGGRGAIGVFEHGRFLGTGDGGISVRCQHFEHVADFQSAASGQHHERDTQGIGRQGHPDIDLRISATMHHVDFAREEVGCGSRRFWKRRRSGAR